MSSFHSLLAPDVAAQYLSDIQWSLAYVVRVNVQLAASLDLGEGSYVLGKKDLEETRDKINALLVTEE